MLVTLTKRQKLFIMNIFRKKALTESIRTRIDFIITRQEVTTIFPKTLQSHQTNTKITNVMTTKNNNDDDMKMKNMIKMQKKELQCRKKKINNWLKCDKTQHNKEREPRQNTKIEINIYPRISKKTRRKIKEEQ